MTCFAAPHSHSPSVDHDLEVMIAAFGDGQVMITGIMTAPKIDTNGAQTRAVPSGTRTGNGCAIACVTEEMDQEGRPWPAPGPDVDWWRREADPDESEDLSATSGPTVLPTRPTTADPNRMPKPIASRRNVPQTSDQPLSWAGPDELATAWPAAELGGTVADVGSKPHRDRSIGPFATPPRTGATEQPARPLPPPAAVMPPAKPVPVPAGAVGGPPRKAVPIQRSGEAAGKPDQEPAAGAAVPSQRPGGSRPASPVLNPAIPGPPARPATRSARRTRSWQTRQRAALRRRPWLGIPALLVLTLAAAFFAWVSAEPFWLALGRGQIGTATVVEASNTCLADIAAGGVIVASNVDLNGVDPAQCRPGATLDARILSATSTKAYATDLPGLHLRWTVGLFLVLLCGLAIAWLTGVTTFAGWRFAAALGLSLTGPAAIAAALLAATHA